MTHRNVLILLSIVGILLAGCAELAPTVGEPAPSATPTMAADNAEAENVLDTAPDIQVSPLAFAGDGDTFLDGIDSAVQEVGRPDHHSYVEIESGHGQLWQGESLAYSDRQVMFLQAVQGGSDTGSTSRVSA